MRTNINFAPLGSCSLISLLTLLFAAHAFAADKLNAPQLIALANSNSPALPDAIRASMDAKELQTGKAWLGRGAMYGGWFRTFVKFFAPVRKMLIRGNT